MFCPISLLVFAVYRGLYVPKILSMKDSNPIVTKPIFTGVVDQIGIKRVMFTVMVSNTFLCGNSTLGSCVPNMQSLNIVSIGKLSQMVGPRYYLSSR